MRIIFLLVFLFAVQMATAQVDEEKTRVKAPEGLRGGGGGGAIPATETETTSFLKLSGNHSLSKKTSVFANIPREYELGEKEEKPFSMKQDNDLKTYVYEDFTPKAFQEKEIRDEYRKDQYLGNFLTTGTFVELYCRDHEYVDGDRVKISVNGKVIHANVFLDGTYTPVLVKLNTGPNTIEFEALNMGTSGPNTAELKVYDEKGRVVTNAEWNLVTGRRASLVVVKQ